MENTRTMDQVLTLGIAATLSIGLVLTGRGVTRRLGGGPRRGHGAPWGHGSRLAAYARMTGPIPELEIVRLGRILATEVEEYLAAQVR